MKMTEPLISVIVPVYNVEKYLAECVNSIIGQTYKNLEIILVDDGSTDTSGKICDEYAEKDDRVKVIHKENGGQASARNVALDVCKGEYITFVDSDDYVDLQYIDYMYKLLKKYNVNISGCKLRLLFFNGNFETQEKELVEKIEPQEVFFENLLYSKRAAGQCGYLHKRELFDNLRYREGIIFEDSDLVYKVFLKCDNVAISNNQLYYYRLRQGSTTNSSFDSKKLGLIDVSEKMCDFILDRFPKLEVAAASKMVWACYSTLNQLYKSKVVDKNTEKMILDKARPYEATVLFDKKASMRDKLGIIMRKFGRKFYILSWNLYMKFFKS